MKKVDVIIAGAGPAGVSAALYTLRAGLSTILFTVGPGTLARAHRIDNYYGMHGISGNVLYENGIVHARQLGGQIVEEEVVGLVQSVFLPSRPQFVATTPSGEYAAGAVIVATGRAAHSSSQLPEASALIGRGVSMCAVCDGFFFRGLPVAVLGSGAYALEEARQLSQLASTVTVYAGKAAQNMDAPDKIIVSSAQLIGLMTDQRGMLCGGRLDNGKTAEFSGLFLAEGKASSSSFAQKLGLHMNDGIITVNESCATNVPGIFAAGDCATKLAQVAMAVSSGAIAGLGAVDFMKN